MNQFSPLTDYLRRRFRGTSFDHIEQFRALLMLEQLTLQPLRNWFDEALYMGLRDRFPSEAELILRDVRRGRFRKTAQFAAMQERSNSYFLLIRNQRLPEQRDRRWRERTIWIESGGQP